MRLLTLLAVFFIASSSFAEIPPRPPTALQGTAFAASVKDDTLPNREAKVVAQFRAGNIPDSLRKPVPILVQDDDNRLIIYVYRDYLAIGSDVDSLRMPLSPLTAQELAESVDCMLPTPKMVDIIYKAATVKHAPLPIPPSASMTTMKVFAEHNAQIEAQYKHDNRESLHAGHKKDVVITAKLKTHPGKVAIYGWHKPDGIPIQPLYLGHVDRWVDYSHGVRFVQKTASLNGNPVTIAAIFADPKLAPLLSDEGVVHQLGYLPPTKIAAGPGEIIDTLMLPSGVRIVINRPADLTDKPVLVVFYALPNGNSIEQTIGKTTTSDDWHFDIQHIAAQLRFLRLQQPDRQIVVAYIENDLKSWPSWRKKYGDESIPDIINSVLDKMPKNSTIALNGHSGGGSLIFGYLNRCEVIPTHIERIAFLDSNYAYDTALHANKLSLWLNASERNVLVVLTYNDAIATIDGKSFVSEKGGTWGRTEQMLADLAKRFQVDSDGRQPVERITALNGRVTVLRHHNPEKKILHTVQVEKNGFIESMLIHTSSHQKHYTYFGDRAYRILMLNN